MNVTFNQFKQLDIRIGTVVEAVVPEWSHWVMKLTVDVGDTKKDPSTTLRMTESDSGLGQNDGNSSSAPLGRSGQKSAPITIFAGIMHFFKPDDLIGKQFPFVVNMEKKKIGPEGDYSEGMMMAADLILDKPIKIGDEEVSDKPVLLTPMEKVPNGTRVM